LHKAAITTSRNVTAESNDGGRPIHRPPEKKKGTAIDCECISVTQEKFSRKGGMLMSKKRKAPNLVSEKSEGLPGKGFLAERRIGWRSMLKGKEE